MCSASRSYQDILAPRRDETSNFMWVSRTIYPKVAYKQPQKTSPEFHKDEVLKSVKIQELLELLSKQQNVAKEVLEVQVTTILNEIGYKKKLKVIRWLGLVLVKICNKACSGIYLNRESVIKLRSQMGDCPVIFVPSHRSYADFILMSLICFTEEIATPAIAAGMDFHGMWGMGSMLRDTGAFFMRRSYNDDNLYWTTFKQYVYQIVTKGELPIEFFVEGTRSRSNKSLTPKYGLILMILKAFFLSQVHDILFVPINISYERILEEKLFAFELLGIPKPKESTKGFFKSLSIVKDKYGSIYFDVAEPISAKQFFGDKFDRAAHNLQPLYLQEITDEEKMLIPALAHEIVYQQQKHCIISCFNLIAIILNSGRALSINELIDEVTWLRSIVEKLGGFVTDHNVFEALDVHSNIVRVDENGLVVLVSDEIVLGKKNVTVKGHSLSEKSLTYSVPFVLLQLYINPVLHYLVDVGIVILVLKQGPKNVDQLFRDYSFVRTLFSQEFVTFANRIQKDFNSALEKAMDLNVVHKSNDGYSLSGNRKCEDVILNCFDCFIYSYFVVCSVILKSDDVVEEKFIFATVQCEIEAKLNDVHPYCLNLDTISNCLNVLSSQKILAKSRNKLGNVYSVKKSELDALKTTLEQYVPEVPMTGVKSFCLRNKL